MKGGRKGRDWTECVKIAEWICIDEMRGLRRPKCSQLRSVAMSLLRISFTHARANMRFTARLDGLRLELWYDDLHFQKWKDKNIKALPRKSGARKGGSLNIRM